MTSPRLTLAIVDTLEQAHDLQRELALQGVQGFVTRQEWQGRTRPVVGYFAANQEQAALLSAALAAAGVTGEVFCDEPAAEVGWSVVFAHPSLQIAHMMRNLLDHHAIEAKVLEVGVRSHEHMGLFELLHVVVPVHRQAEAAEVVDEFLKRMSNRAAAEKAAQQLDEPSGSPDDYETPDEWEGEILIEWPHCPQCGQPRETMCPKCRHIGHHLPQAETPIDAEDLAAIRKEPTFVELRTGVPGVRSQGTSEGPAGEDQRRFAAAGGETLNDSRLRPQPHDEAHWVLCPICDWLFQPKYYRRCAWCSHNFGDGLDIEPPRNLEREPINVRMLLLAGGLLALMLAVLFYFGSLAN